MRKNKATVPFLADVSYRCRNHNYSGPCSCNLVALSSARLYCVKVISSWTGLAQEHWLLLFAHATLQPLPSLIIATGEVIVEAGMAGKGETTLCYVLVPARVVTLVTGSSQVCQGPGGVLS